MAFRYQCPIESFKGQGLAPDPLTDNWTYDSAIDLFSFTPILPDPFALDLPDDLMNFEPKDLPADVFSMPPDVSGFAVSNEDTSESASDPESDDHPWSPTNVPLDIAPAHLSPNPSNDTELVPKQEPTPSSPETHIPATSPPKPRSSSTTTTRRRLSSDTGSGPTTRNAAKRAAHNVIEKRYRTNMNAKFVALEKAMSGDTSVPKFSKAGGGGGGGSASLKKSEILSNAIAYMHELQEENRYLQKEVAMMKGGFVGSAGAGGGVWRTGKREVSGFR